MGEINPFTVFGVLLILLGVIFVALPYLENVIPNLERVPWIILWVYRSGGFTFATSPLLIIISVISILLAYLRGR
jgi:hypothetical protein